MPVPRVSCVVLMDSTARIWVLMRAGVLLLAVVAIVCAGDLARPAMVMAGGQDCAGPACEDQIVCGQPTQPQASSGSSIHLAALRVSTERAPGFFQTETRTVGPPPARVIVQPAASLASRSPPAV